MVKMIIKGQYCYSDNNLPKKLTSEGFICVTTLDAIRPKPSSVEYIQCIKLGTIVIQLVLGIYISSQGVQYIC